MLIIGLYIKTFGWLVLGRDGIKPRFSKRPGSGPRPGLEENYPLFCGPSV